MPIPWRMAEFGRRRPFGAEFIRQLRNWMPQTLTFDLSFAEEVGISLESLANCLSTSVTSRLQAESRRSAV